MCFMANQYDVKFLKSNVLYIGLVVINFGLHIWGNKFHSVAVSA